MVSLSNYQPSGWPRLGKNDGNIKDCARRDVFCHAVFGHVSEGLDVLQSLTPRDPSRALSPGDLIKTIRIEDEER